MGKNRLLIVFTGVIIQLLLASCTYDYFKDETNYQVYVPEVVDNKVSDCRVLVYDETGVLVGARYEAAPWKDPRMRAGLFSFRLPPGEYKVYCYTNTDSLSFADEQQLETSAFMLNNSSSGENHYVHPSDVLFQKFVPVIDHPGVLRTDTVELEHYTGRVTVRFKNFPGDVSRIENVQLLAEGVSTVQYLKYDTIAGRQTRDDHMFHFGELPAQITADYLEVDHRYLPSVEGEFMRLNYTFLDSDGVAVNHLPVEVKDTLTGLPLRLLHGRRIIIEIDSYVVIKVSIVGWNEDIESGDTNME